MALTFLAGATSLMVVLWMQNRWLLAQVPRRKN